MSQRNQRKFLLEKGNYLPMSFILFGREFHPSFPFFLTPLCSRFSPFMKLSGLFDIKKIQSFFVCLSVVHPCHGTTQIVDSISQGVLLVSNSDLFIFMNVFLTFLICISYFNRTVCIFQQYLRIIRQHFLNRLLIYACITFSVDFVISINLVFVIFSFSSYSNIYYIINTSL